MKRFLRLFAFIVALLALAPTASAEVAYMSGLFGVKPDYSTITPLKPADVCDATCHYIKHDNISVQSGTRSLGAWLGEHGAGPDTVWTYSQSAASAMDYLSTHPNDLSDQWYLLGTPKSAARQGFSLPAGDYSNVTFVVVEGDRVATGKGTWRAHVRGYDNLDLNNPKSSSVDPTTGATTLYFAAPTTTTRIRNSSREDTQWAGSETSLTSAAERQTLRQQRQEQRQERRESRQEARQERREERREARQERRQERAER